MVNGNLKIIKITYPKLAGYKIQTVDDLTAAIKRGDIDIKNLPVDYVDMNGTRLILNTRTSTALQDAGIPKSQWYGTNRTGQTAVINKDGTIKTFDGLANDQLKNNKLPSTGSPTLPTSIKDK
jgi:filamentous hemagglutinin